MKTQKKKTLNKIICGDCTQILPTLPHARMVFADPPDNLGIDYDGFKDNWKSDAAYMDWLLRVCSSGMLHSDVFWISYYWKWDWALKALLGKEIGTFPVVRNVKPFVWWYTFGQHNKNDCGSCFRPMLRFSKENVKWRTKSIREPSARQRVYHDTRAHEEGRVPGDVWDCVWKFSRVCGTFKEKRKWHKNQHPESLIERMIRMSTKPGDLVIDMFAGTGTVNRVCKRLKRKCIGIEISKKYCEQIRKELR